jgi:hypothetical protein
MRYEVGGYARDGFLSLMQHLEKKFVFHAVDRLPFDDGFFAEEIVL